MCIRDRDYTVRAKVVEVINSAMPCKLGVAEAYMSNGSTFPTSVDAAGCTTVVTKYVASVAVGANGIVTVTSKASGLGGSPAADTKTVIFTPTGSASGVDWTCTGGDMPDKYRPANCR